MYTNTYTTPFLGCSSKTLLLQCPQPRWLSPSEPYQNSMHNDVPHAPISLFSNRFVKDFASLYMSAHVYVGPCICRPMYMSAHVYVVPLSYISFHCFTCPSVVLHSHPLSYIPFHCLTFFRAGLRPALFQKEYLLLPVKTVGCLLLQLDACSYSWMLALAVGCLLLQLDACSYSWMLALTVGCLGNLGYLG